MDELVMVEWYTYGRIPRMRHAVVVPRSRAELWLQQGLKVSVAEIFPQLIREAVDEQTAARTTPRRR